MSMSVFTSRYSPQVNRVLIVCVCVCVRLTHTSSIMKMSVAWPYVPKLTLHYIYGLRRQKVAFPNNPLMGKTSNLHTLSAHKDIVPHFGGSGHCFAWSKCDFEMSLINTYYCILRRTSEILVSRVLYIFVYLKTLKTYVGKVTPLPNSCQWGNMNAFMILFEWH